MKPIHPADAANAALIEQAIRFDIALFLGAGAYDRASVQTKEEATEMAAKMKAAHPECTRLPIVYAITAEGRSAIVKINSVTEAKQEQTMTAKTFDKKFNAQRKAISLAARFPTVEFAVIANPAGKGFVVAANLTAETIHEANVVEGQGAFVNPPAVAAPAPKPEIESNVVTMPAKAKTSAKKTAPAPKAKVEKPASGKRAEILAAAEAGKMPAAPDFSAPTHARFRKKLEEVIALAKAGDIKGLAAYEINPISTSPKAIAKYRDLCVIALKAKAKKAAA